MATKKKTKNEVSEKFKEKELPEEQKVEVLSPSEYFEKIKGKMVEETSENVAKIYDVAVKQMKRFIVTGQKTAAKDLYTRCLYLEKEMNLLDTGITKYVERKEIENYIDNVADDCVVVTTMSDYDRIIPDEIIDVVAEVMDIFDEFYIVFTDYTGEKRSKVEKERREKDPILFGNIYVDGRVSQKMYFIGDWIDEYCDLTLDKMVSEIAKKEKKDKSEIVYDINDMSILDNIEKELFGSSTRVEARTVSRGQKKEDE